jgi:phosphatidate phosphatase APP1
MILRSYSTEPIDPYAFKQPHLEAIVGAFPRHRWVLYGDSGEKDPEVYTALRRGHPSQIEHIFIHDVTGEDPASPRFQGMTVFRDWRELVDEPAPPPP